MSWQKSLLVIWKIVRLFVNTLTIDEKCSLLNGDNLAEAIQILLSEKQKVFLQFVFAFLKLRLNFENFPERDDPHS